MTNEEVTEVLKELWRYEKTYRYTDSQIREALEKAIEALKAEPCENAISRKAALDLQYRIDDSATLSTRDVVNVDDIEDLPPVTLQPKQRWIPVSERLPEKNMRCLVAVGRFTFTEIATYSDLMGTIDHRIFYQGDYGYEDFKDITQCVKAWMPLPEPYKASLTGAEGSEE